MTQLTILGPGMIRARIINETPLTTEPFFDAIFEVPIAYTATDTISDIEARAMAALNEELRARN